MWILLVGACLERLMSDACRGRLSLARVAYSIAAWQADGVDGCGLLVCSGS